MAAKDREYGMLLQKVKSMEKILMGNGTKGLMKKMEEAIEAIIRMEQASSTEDKIESKFDKWSRTKLIAVFGLAQAIFIIILNFVLNHFGGR